MNRVYCLSYDLRAPGKDYAGLIEELKKSPNWWHYLESTWLIYTSESAQQLFSRISGHLDTNDRMLIIKVSPDYSGWLTEEAWQWIKQYLG